MPINSKRKGASGELEFSKLCQEQGYEVRRTAQYCGKTGQAGDVEGLPGVHVEVKRRERINVYEAYEQATRDNAANGEGKIPIVAHRKSRKPWLIIVSAEDFFKLYKAYLGSD